MKVIVLGGAGFIGRHVCRGLVSRNHEVVCMDVNPAQDTFEGLQDRIKTVHGDVTHFEDVVSALRENDIDRVINLAYLLADESHRRAHVAVRVNVLGMDNTFEAARLCGVRRIVYASSIAYHGRQSTYGDRLVTEDDAAAPTGVYGMTKQFNEFMANYYARAFDLEMIGIRISLVVGANKPRGLQDAQGPIVMSALGEPVVSAFNANTRLLVAHVEDVADLFVRAVLAENPQHRVYHCGGHTVTMEELAAIVTEYIPDARITFPDQQETEELLVYLVDGTRAADEFGFRHRSIRESVKKIIDDTRAGASI